MLKFSQAGAIIGGVVGGAHGAFKANHTPTKGFMIGSRNGMLIGLPIGLCVCYGWMNSLKKVNLTNSCSYHHISICQVHNVELMPPVW